MRETETRLFVSDMDGTLLQKDFTISKEDAEAVKRLQEQGICFAVATGRTYFDAKTICERHGLKPYVISNNGSCVYSADGELLYSRPIRKDILKDLVLYLEENRLCYGVSSSVRFMIDKNWETRLDEEVQSLEQRGMKIPEWRLTFAKEETVRQNGFTPVDHTDQLITLSEMVYSISIVTFDPDKIERLEKRLESYETLMHSVSGSHNIEITEKRANKGNALEYLCGLLHLDLEQAVAVGDNLNDLSMLEKAGTKIAVENAREEVKAVCDFVTKSHTCSGVAYAVHNFINEPQ